MSRRSLANKLTSMCMISGGGALFFVGFNFYKNDYKFYDEMLMPLTRKFIEPETAHNISIFAAKYGLFPKSRYIDPPNLCTKLLNIDLTNPIGLAAGLDKQGDATLGLCNLGFSFVEVGSVTPLPQLGNPKPRVFRLPEDKAVINRYGFNSDGHEAVHDRLELLKTNKNFKGALGVNLGKNKDSVDAVSDYVIGIKRFSDIADYFVINVSSPNTPGLRDMQQKENLRNLLSNVILARNAAERNPPIFLKLSPDLTQNEVKDIIDVIKQKDCKIDGLLISNTTTERKGLLNELAQEAGGLSGKPLTDRSTEMIRNVYKLTNGSFPIIGVGGVFTGTDAYEKILAGASVIQIYTSFIYHGPPVVERIKAELSTRLAENNYKNIAEAVGKGVK